MTAYDLDELRGLSLARQFPEVDGRGRRRRRGGGRPDRPDPVADRPLAVRRAGRAPARRHPRGGDRGLRVLADRPRQHHPRHRPHLHRRPPGAARRDHPGRPAHALARFLRLDQAELDDVWAAIEDYARDEWRTPAELRELPPHLARPPRRDRGGERLDNQAGRYFALRPRRPGAPAAARRLVRPGRSRLPHGRGPAARPERPRRPGARGGAHPRRVLRSVQPARRRLVVRARAAPGRRPARPARPDLARRPGRPGVRRPARPARGARGARRTPAAGVRRPPLRLRPAGPRPLRVRGRQRRCSGTATTA